jgi:cathepsin L
MKNVVAKIGVIGVVMYAEDHFQHYHYGVFKPNDCNGTVNHGPLITGYGTDPKDGDYWIIKNSWGASP